MQDNSFTHECMYLMARPLPLTGPLQPKGSAGLSSTTPTYLPSWPNRWRKCTRASRALKCSSTGRRTCRDHLKVGTAVVWISLYSLSYYFTALGNKLFGVPERFQVEVARANTILDQERWGQWGCDQPHLFTSWLSDYTLHAYVPLRVSRIIHVHV